MPEMTFDVRWPDGTSQRCYSPSLVMHDYLSVGTRYTVTDFVQRCAHALHQASERVRAKYGFACTSAAQTNDEIITAAADFDPYAVVQVTAMHPALETS